MRYSVLDLFGTPLDTIDLVGRCEELGYHRYWVGEHHSPHQCTNPVLLGAVLQGLTDRIRIGTGAVGLDGRNPYLVAEDGRMVSSLYGDRFDLGVSRGLAFAGRQATRLLLEGRTPAEVRAGFEDRVRTLHAFLTGRPNETIEQVDMLSLDRAPPLWLVGTSPGAGALAGRLGLGFCTSLHHARTIAGAREAIETYRDGFTPSPEFAEPRVILVVSGFCRRGEDMARRDLAAYLEPPPDLTPAQRARSINPEHLFAGSPERCGEAIEGFARLLAPDELMFLDLSLEASEILEGLELLAELFVGASTGRSASLDRIPAGAAT